MTNWINPVLLRRTLIGLGLVLGLALVLMLLWPVPGPARVGSVERWIEPLAGARFDRQGFAELARKLPDFAALQARSGTAWQAITLPDARALPAIVDAHSDAPLARVWLRFWVEVDPSSTHPDTAYAILGNRMVGGGYAIWANGKRLHANLNDWPTQFNTPLFLTLPLELTQTGQSVEVLIAMPYRLAQGYAVGTFYAGPVATVRQAYEWRMTWQRRAPLAMNWMLLFVGVMSLHLWWHRRQDRANLVLAGLAVAGFVCNCQYFYNPFDSEIVNRWYNAIVDAAVSWVLMLLVFFAFRIRHAFYPRVELAIMLFVMLVTLITLPVWGWQKNALVLQHILNVVAAVAATGFLTWQALQRATLEDWVLAATLWCVTLFGIHDTMTLTSQTSPDQVYWFPYVALLIATSFVFIMQRKKVEALLEIEHFNKHLRAFLQQREQELAEQHQALLALERSQVLLHERQRLVQDMHDGMGSALMTSMFKAQHGSLTADEMSTLLRDCLDDLKTVIDSLEPVENDLSVLLGMLRQRFGERIKGAGLELVWSVSDIPTLPWLNPPNALQVMRIVQEVLTNVIKHARATQIHVTVTPPTSDDGRVNLTIADNGIGFDADTPSDGRGLRHIRERVGTFGGDIVIKSCLNGGTCVSVFLPVEHVAQPVI